MMHHNQTVRAQLLPFDEITSQIGPRPRNSPRMSQSPQKNYDQTQRKRLYLLSKVNDPSFEFPKKPKNWLHRKLNAIDQHYPIIKPQSLFMVLWNFFMLISILFNLFEIPIALFMTEKVYEFQLNTTAPLIMNITFLAGFILDSLVVRFNLAYYKEGKLITARVLIFKRYVQLLFWIDLVAIFVIFVYLASGQSNLIYLKMLFYLKIVTLIKVDKDILQWLNTSLVKCCLYRLFRVIVLIWFVTVWVSSIYFAIDFHYYNQRGYYYETGQLWLTNSNLVFSLNLIDTFPWYIWLEYAMYWSLQTSSTIGYGDMTPRNPHEVLYCNFIIVLNTVLFAYYMNTIWSVLGDLQESSNRYSENWAELKSFMKTEQFPVEVKQKLSRYLHEIWINETEEAAEEDFENMLSDDLHTELYLSIRGKFFSSLQIFQELNHFSPLMKEVMKELVYELESQNIAQSQTLYTFGDANFYLYFLLQGKILLSIKSLDLYTKVTIFQNFGFQQFLTEQNRLITAQSLTFCKVWKLSSEKFKKTIRKYAALYEKYVELRQRIMLDESIEIAGIQCIKCQSSKHFYRSCQQVNSWRNNLSKVVHRHKFSHQQESQQANRQKFNRKYGKSKKIFSNISFDQFVNCDKIASTQGYRRDYNLHSR